METFISIAFTGTRKGMTEQQGVELEYILKRAQSLGNVILHQGDCVGADEGASYIAYLLDIPIVSHPPISSSKRAFWKKGVIEEKEPHDYLVRNRNMVDECDVLIACPYESNEVLRSGTWATIRYARKTKTKCQIIYPSGLVYGTVI